MVFELLFKKQCVYVGKYSVSLKTQIWDIFPGH
jgi:hypothetical protein